MSPQSDLAFAPLLTPQGMDLLASLPPYNPDDALRLGQQLRSQGYSPELVAAALTQQRLRERARMKFGPFASQLLFTPDGLEQATRLQVSAHHARRYMQAGAALVADLGCGIAGDALALAGLGLGVLAVDIDEPTAALATVNLLPFPQARVMHADARQLDLQALGVDAVFADPARRSGGRRIEDPQQWSPALSEVLALRKQVDSVGIKVAPGIDYGFLPSDCHAQWVSVDGDVVEAGIWCGPLALEGPGRSALVLRATRQANAHAHTQAPSPQREATASAVTIESPALGEYQAFTLTDPSCRRPDKEPEQLDPIAAPDELKTFLFEPDGAAIRAGLVAYLAARLNARPVGARIAYLTGDTPLPDELAPFVRAWHICDVLPLHLKTLKRYAREHNIGGLEIHKRGVDVSPDALRASLRLSGNESGIWAVTRIGSTHGQGPGKGAVLVLKPTPDTKRATPQH